MSSQFVNTSSFPNFSVFFTNLNLNAAGPRIASSRYFVLASSWRIKENVFRKTSHVKATFNIQPNELFQKGKNIIQKASHFPNTDRPGPQPTIPHTFVPTFDFCKVFPFSKKTPVPRPLAPRRRGAAISVSSYPASAFPPRGMGFARALARFNTGGKIAPQKTTSRFPNKRGGNT